MANDKKDGWTYIDDIPFKITSTFLPPPPVQISVASTAMKFDEYDFSFERKVLEEIQLKENLGKTLKSVTSPAQDLSSVKPSAQVIVPFQSEILLPKTQKSLDNAPINSEQKNAKINLSDFENDTSSPFDYVELQTINDFEELSSVFQGLGNRCSSNSNANQGSSAEGNSFPKSMSFAFPRSDSKQLAEIGAKAPDLSEAPGVSDLKEVPFLPLATAKNRNSEEDLSVPSSKSSLRSCKSYSDIHALTEKCINMFPCKIPQRDVSLKDANVSPALNVSCDKPVCLPDPYYELPEESRHFVDAVTGMGFSRSQVSRTVKHLGADEKTVIEHLCQIQHLEDCGYDSLEAEAALHLHDYNQDQAKQFLDLINKFQDLGFEKNAVKKALIQNKNDESKTIDALLS